MKPRQELISELKPKIADALVGIGLEPHASLVDGLSSHLGAVLEANRHVNLTAITAPDDAVELHIIDSLLALPEVLAAPAGSLADLGSGAGYPGIPLALASGRAAVLIESSGKKCGFLEGVARELAGRADLTVACARAEEYARDHRAQHAVVVARAVSSLASLLELASPLLEDRGTFVALKGEPGEDELSRAESVGEKVGLVPMGTRRAMLPGGAGRTICLFRRQGQPAMHLPRAVGRAQTRPLA